MSQHLVGVKNKVVVANVGTAKEKNGAEAFVALCEESNYMAFDDYSKFGHLNLGRAIHWRQGDFYVALQKLDASGKDTKLEESDPRLCKENRRYIPCFAKQQTIEHSVKFEEGDELKYFKKTKSGHWGFKYNKMRKFMKIYGDQISTIVDVIEEERAEIAELKKMKRDMAKARGCTVAELEVAIVKETYAQL